MRGWKRRSRIASPLYNAIRPCSPTSLRGRRLLQSSSWERGGSSLHRRIEEEEGLGKAKERREGERRRRRVSHTPPPIVTPILGTVAAAGLFLRRPSQMRSDLYTLHSPHSPPRNDMAVGTLCTPDRARSLPVLTQCGRGRTNPVRVQCRPPFARGRDTLTAHEAGRPLRHAGHESIQSDV